MFRKRLKCCILNKIINWRIIPVSHHISNLIPDLKKKKEKKKKLVAQKAYYPGVENYNTWNKKHDITENTGGSCYSKTKTKTSRTSLVVQWIRLCTPNAGGPVRSLIREIDPTCMPQIRVRMPQLRNRQATTKTQHNQINK